MDARICNCMHAFLIYHLFVIIIYNTVCYDQLVNKMDSVVAIQTFINSAWHRPTQLLDNIQVHTTRCLTSMIEMHDQHHF